MRKFVPKDLINNELALFQMIGWQKSAEPLYESSLLTHIYILLISL